MRWTSRGRLDALIQAATDHTIGRHPKFQIRDVLLLVEQGVPGTKLHGLGNVLRTVRTTLVGWEIERVLRDYAVRRIREYVNQTKTERLHGGGNVEVRLFEAYRDSRGHWIWQRMTSMTVSELRTCVAQRRARMQGEVERVQVYEQLIRQLEALGNANATVGEVFARVFVTKGA